jgi:HEAT repeat protein
MGVMSKMADTLIERLQDEDHLVRVAAAEALQFCTAADVRSALLAAVGDRSVAVQNAAKSSLRALGAEERQEAQRQENERQEKGRKGEQTPALVGEATA